MRNEVRTRFYNNKDRASWPPGRKKWKKPARAKPVATKLPPHSPAARDEDPIPGQRFLDLADVALAHEKKRK